MRPLWTLDTKDWIVRSQRTGADRGESVRTGAESLLNSEAVPFADHAQEWVRRESTQFSPAFRKHRLTNLHDETS